MTCPNCGQILNSVRLDNQTIFHCLNCGGSFFEENGINRISLRAAQILFDDKKTDEIVGQLKFCPKDNSSLSPIQNEPAVPPDVTLLRCGSCHGVFTYPDDLLNFKKAQQVKVDFFKLWGKPLPSLRTVLILSFTLLVLGSVIYQANFFNRLSYQSQAHSLIKKTYISSSGRYLFISFTTTQPLRSAIVFFDETKKQTIKKTVSTEPVLTHILTTSDVDMANKIYYQIILRDDRGNEIKTELKKLQSQ